MARKVRKRGQQSKSMLVLFIELLVPWLVMGGTALVLVSAGMSGTPAFVLALGAALATTVFIWFYEKKRAMRARINGKPVRRK